MKVAIVGSRTYTNRKKIKEFIFNLKQKFGKELVVVSGGQKDGADGYAKKYSLEFNVNYEKIRNYTLNPKSRLFTIFEMSKRYLISDTAFIEVGSWKGGVSGIVALANKDKKIDFFVCDTFSGVVNSSQKDTFFKNSEYNNATSNAVSYTHLTLPTSG